MNTHDLHTALDACRPGTNDHCDPDLAPLAEELRRNATLQRTFERRQQFDRQVQTALHNVAAPPGLEARLLAALESAAVAEVTLAPSPARAKSSTGRRTWMALAAACLLAGLGAGIFWSGERTPVTADELLAAAPGWIEAAADEWNDDLSASPSQDYPFDRAALRARVTRWRNVKTPLDSEAVMYELVVDGQLTGTLTVLRSAQAIEDLPSFAPGVPQSDTGNRAVAAWQHDALVFVLAVEGSTAQYRRFLRNDSIAFGNLGKSAKLCGSRGV